MSKLHFLPVGEADCFVLELDTPYGRRTVLIDGGSREDRRIDLPAWLRAHGIERIDLLVLTHLHEDHLGALPEVAEQLAVARAALPFQPFGITSEQAAMEVPAEKKACGNDIVRYDRLWNALRTQGTEIKTFYPLEETLVFRFGTYTLTGLSPLPGTRSQVRDGIGDITGRTFAELSARRAAVESSINAESAVFLLEREGEQLVLFSADCEASAIDRARAARPLHPQVLKLSHHGRNTDGRISYTKEQIVALAPETIVVTYAPYKSPDRRAIWRMVYPSARLLITGDYPDGLTLEI